jgi:hypothetical protein
MSGVQIFPVVCSSLCCCLISTKSKELCWERLRLSLRGCLYADWTACSFKCHRRRARCRLASFHEAGDLPILEEGDGYTYLFWDPAGHGASCTSPSPPFPPSLCMVCLCTQDNTSHALPLLTAQPTLEVSPLANYTRRATLSGFLIAV